MLKSFLRISASNNDFSKQDEVIGSKYRLLRQLYRSIYSDLFALLPSDSSLRILEIGAGLFPLSNFDERIISSDVIVRDDLDLVIDGCKMNLDSSSFDVIVMINSFHHLYSPTDFFDEALRVLSPNGKIFIFDPSDSLFARFLYPRLHHDEIYDLSGPIYPWKQNMLDSMLGANQALSSVIFKSSAFRNYYSQKFDIELFSYLGQTLTYICTGGVNFRSLIPTNLFPFVRFIDRLLCSNKLFSLHHLILIGKI